jgi:hypothetical protein
VEQRKAPEFNREERVYSTLGARKEISKMFKRVRRTFGALELGRRPGTVAPAKDDSGAVLILALIFLIVVGGVVGSLSTWAMNDLNNTSQFTSARTTQYAVSSATQTAIANIRYTPLLSTTYNASLQAPASPPAPCWGSGTTSGLTGVDGYNVDVWCSTAWNASSVNTRVVTFYACTVTAAQASQSLPAAAASALASSCAANPYLQAVVTFGDYPSGVSRPNPAECQVYCGQSMTVNSWVWS